MLYCLCVKATYLRDYDYGLVLYRLWFEATCLRKTAIITWYFDLFCFEFLFLFLLCLSSLSWGLMRCGWVCQTFGQDLTFLLGAFPHRAEFRNNYFWWFLSIIVHTAWYVLHVLCLRQREQRMISRAWRDTFSRAWRIVITLAWRGLRHYLIFSGPRPNFWN